MKIFMFVVILPIVLSVFSHVAIIAILKWVENKTGLYIEY